MNEIRLPVRDRPYRDSLVSGLAAALLAALTMVVVDVGLAVGRGAEGTRELWLIVAALYAWPALITGAVAGLVLGTWRASFGESVLSRVFRTLRDRPAVDAAATAGVISAAVAALGFAGVVSVGALMLVADVQRQAVGAVLLAVVLLLSLPALALLSLPVYRLSHRAARALPRIGRIPTTALLLITGVMVASLAVFSFAQARLDWRALDLDPLFMLLSFLSLAAVFHWLCSHRLAHVVNRVAYPGLVVATLSLATMGLALSGLAIAPATDSSVALTEQTSGARVLLRVARAFSDSDGDGFSALLGGPDCDDDNPAVHPDAREIADNGIDDNCLGGDRISTGEEPDARPDQPAVATPDPRPIMRNALIIMVDTLRADRLGAAGYRRRGRSLTPNLDQLASSGTYFARTYAQGPNTARSFPALITSRYSSLVAVDRHFKNFSSVLPENQTVFECLHDAGVRTVGVSSHYYFRPERGVRQGFDDYDNDGALSMTSAGQDVAAPRIVPKVQTHLRALAESGERFALFAHLFEPHSNYLEHDGLPLTESGRARTVQAYDYEIAFVDTWVGKILETLESTGLHESTVVVFVSDHGEAFGEHRIAGRRSYYHGKSLYDETLRVPFIIRAPKGVTRAIDQPVMVIDVAPTLLDLMGIDRPQSFMGRSLVPALEGKPMAEKNVFSELLPAPYLDRSAKMMVTGDGRYKLIYMASERRFELYDLVTDPGEQRDVYRDQKPLADRLRAELVDWIEVTLQSSSAAED